MTPTLKWKPTGNEGSYSDDLLPVWHCALHRVGEGWLWVAMQPDGRGYHRGVEPTTEAAQLACEAALWKLGVMPQPAWMEPGGSRLLALVGTLRARVWPHSGNLSPCWLVDTADGVETLAQGDAATFAAAKARAETVLRTLIADAVERGGEG